jgi:16S rRNA (cytidine1402-2'-O)-methyltransferase
VSDAGTPAISDPGTKLIAEIYNQAPTVPIISIPGPSAVTCAVSISGFNASQYLFLGYPPKKKRRNAFFKEIAACEKTCVFFSTPYRITKDLAALEAQLEQTDVSANKTIFVAREMTKRFETLYRGGIGEVIQKIKNSPQKGEYTVVVGK